MNTAFFVVLLFLLAFLFLLNSWLNKPSSTGSWTVYGTDGCGWTRKQLKELDDKKISYTYVNCETEDCGDITAFPTLKSADGTVKVGFTSNL
jgi:hypothetical protein